MTVPPKTKPAIVPHPDPVDAGNRKLLMAMRLLGLKDDAVEPQPKAP
jgi:hypothetical protein